MSETTRRNLHYQLYFYLPSDFPSLALSIVYLHAHAAGAGASTLTSLILFMHITSITKLDIGFSFYN